MGLNMPAHTVVFTGLQKWDGVAHRFMASGEYIQASRGRQTPWQRPGLGSRVGFGMGSRLGKGRCQRKGEGDSAIWGGAGGVGLLVGFRVQGSGFRV